jgi:hypothetical protein
MTEMDGFEVVAEMRRLRGAPAGRVMMARRKVTSDCAVTRAQCRAETLEAKWRRLRPDGELWLHHGPPGATLMAQTQPPALEKMGTLLSRATGA